MAGVTNNVTTVFSANTSNFRAGVKEMNQQMKLAQSEFKATTAGMENWAKSTDGLKAKLKQLDTNLTAQKSVLQQMEQQYRDVVAAQGENSTAAQRMLTQLNNQRAAVADTEKQIKQYNKALKDLTKNDAQKAVKDLGKEFEGMAKVAAAAFAAIAAAATAAFAEALSSANDASKAMNDFAAKTGTAVDDMQQYKDVMTNIYNANFGESFEDIADAMSEVKQQARDIGADELEKMTINALMLRDTFDFDINESMRAASSLMDQFGITSDEAFNLIAQGAQEGLNKNGDLLDVVNEYSVQFANTGLSAQDMFNMIRNGAYEGVWSIDKMGDAFKELKIRMSDGTANEYLESIGLNAEDVVDKFNKGGDSAKEAMSQIADALLKVEDPTAQYVAGVGLMGTMFEDMGIDAVTSLLRTEGEISTTKDALEQINSVKYDDIGSAIEGIKRNLETGLLMPIGDAILPKLNELANKFSEWLADPSTKQAIDDLSKKLIEFVENGIAKIVEAVNWFLDNKDIVIGALTAIAAGFAAFKIASIIISLTKAFKALFTAVKAGNTIMQALNLTIAANPIALIVGAIAALVAAFIYFWNTSEEFRQFWIDLWEGIKEAAGKAFEGIKKIFSGIGEFFGNIFGSAKDVVSEKLNNIKSAFQENGGGIKGVLAATWEGIKGYYTSGFDFINNLTGGKLDWIKEKFNSIWTSITDFLSNAWETIKNVVQVGIMFIESIFQAAFDIITLPFRFIWENIKEYVFEAFEYIKNIIQTAIENIVERFIIFRDKVIEIFTAVKEFFVTIWTAVKDFVVEIVTKIVNFYVEKFLIIKNKVVEIFTAIKEFFSTVWSAIKTAISNVVLSIVNFLTEKFNAIKEKVTNPVNDAKNTVTKTFDTMKNNVSEKVNAILTTVTTIFGKIKSKIDEIITAAKKIVSDGIDKIKDTFNFDWKFPDLKMPHFSIKGEFSLDPPSVPKLGIDWYARGGVMDGSTLFGMSGNRLKVGGEAGMEAILPLEQNTSWASLLAKVLLEEVNKIVDFSSITDVINRLSTTLTESNDSLVNNLAAEMMKYQTAMAAALKTASQASPSSSKIEINQTITNTKTSSYELYRATRNAVTLFQQ